MKSKAIEFAIMAIQSFADNSGCFEEALGEFEITEDDLVEVVEHLETMEIKNWWENYPQGVVISFRLHCWQMPKEINENDDPMGEHMGRNY